MIFTFLNFLAIFLEMAARLGWERNSGLKFFSLFPSLSQPVLDRNNAGIYFFNFLNFFAIFFGIFLPGSSMNGIRDKNFFLPFSAYLIPNLLKIMPDRGFLIFRIFLLFLSELSCPGWVWTQFGTKIFFFSFSVSLNPFWIEIMSELTFLIFKIFLLFFFGIF